MEQLHSTTFQPERKRGQHLGAEERGSIQSLKKLGYSNREIAKEINCSPSTVGYELRRGTPPYSGKGRKPSYSAKRGMENYKTNRSRCRRPKKYGTHWIFIQWMVEMMRMHKWSFDTCVGRAKFF